ncbi:DNA/RNA helicase domain-containing protein [Plastoroseomonas arctica]|nr:DNA/RNA helicase domain-containing protein [Plastoroseomonas arctica]
MSVVEFLAREPADIAGRLAAHQVSRGYTGTAEQQTAWDGQIKTLRAALCAFAGAGWTLALEFDLLRLEKRIDAVLLTDRAILAMEFKTAGPTLAALAEAEDYALDLRDFHAGSRAHAIVPVLVAGSGGFVPPLQAWLLPKHPTEPLVCGPRGLAALIAWVQAAIPADDAPLDGPAWLAAPYRPTPNIIEAATMLYARNGVAEIAAARADAANLSHTTAAIARVVAEARATGSKRIIFVTGIPGAGKTLCGLNTVFGVAHGKGAAFLTGNVPLVTVLRAAIVADALARRECARPEAERRAIARLQNVHRFLEDGVTDEAHHPAERLIVFDEAQRAWDEAKAVLGTRNKPSKLSMSEPAHTLAIMGRHEGWAVIVALIGQGQEINTGEAGLAEWGRVIATDPRWHAHAAHALPNLPEDRRDADAALDLTVPLRSVRESCGAAWVDAVLRGAADEAARLAATSDDFPFHLTRDLDAMRVALRTEARGLRRAGLVASAGAKRLRADGLGVQLEDVANWFLLRWPDVRASDALETIATEYDCQGLELDLVGIAWGGDFIRVAGGWAARRFVGSVWQRDAKEFDFVRNTYRVLLTRARYETIIYVPRGDAADRTRSPAEFDAIADFLLACGARPLVQATATRTPALVPLLL